MEYEKHKAAVRGEMSLAKVKSFFTAWGSISDYAVLVAECAFSLRTMKHHSSYKRVDIIPVLFKTVFPDSEIVHKFQSLTTKTESNSVIAPHAIENIMQLFESNTVTYCGIATDAVAGVS
jgi:hypothetical protein